ncbi:L-amino acid N-acyltransferase YncA [Tumebacillus sp. BK434]|uniref:GNAT family N-acetyltransferase n=1 Tax=Tumebacillus sp. BK434 TaxID=2512169 RepID=UPI00104D8B30|nr:GNAT family N-acetyltransferase [Tumebacillus sp. BK434]TCP58166.1 L-amino acid N-acyltransferase YncA [Tumebacillus sp. BK434]
MEIIRAVGADFEFVNEHGAHSLHEGTRGTFQTQGNEQRVQELLNALWERGAYPLVAKEAEQVLGWITIGTAKDPFSGDEVGFLYELYVLGEHRGRGLGRQLMERGIQELREQGYQEIRLNVFSGNPAQKLYEALGFRTRNLQMELK